MEVFRFAIEAPRISCTAPAAPGGPVRPSGAGSGRRTRLAVVLFGSVIESGKAPSDAEAWRRAHHTGTTWTSSGFSTPRYASMSSGSLVKITALPCLTAVRTTQASTASGFFLAGR